MGQVLGQLGGAQQPQAQQAPPLGPESLMAILSNLFMASPQSGAMVQGPGGTNPSAIGSVSFSALLPMLAQFLQTPLQGPGAGGVSTLPGMRRPEGNPASQPRRMLGAGVGGGQAADPSMGAASMLGRLGLV